ncbi:YraN family protein [Bowmanella dokdonensis]|uniref:UPF0102 protein J0A66_02460 n=1 Tax=Bowmanella dokdonensis TaxID=751969 RepID=A0A939DK88_9ALTE|nr:YraN family protein [Bowmanella dokdonensis]MBN7824079.1 YraN family protein [Bowmanella dokdonensis]
MPRIRQLLSGLLGRQAEDLACRYLCAQGLELIERNYRCKMGEIDLVMRHRQELVFVEVKYRSSTRHGQAAEYFDDRKRRKFEAALSHYLSSKGHNPAQIPHRIDLVAINGQDIQWITHL